MPMTFEGTRTIRVKVSPDYTKKLPANIGDELSRHLLGAEFTEDLVETRLFFEIIKVYQEDQRFGCSDPERAFLNTIKESYLKFRKRFVLNNHVNLDNELDPEEIILLYLTIENPEGDSIISELEPVVRAWEEELDV